MERAHWTPNMKRPSSGYTSDDGLKCRPVHYYEPFTYYLIIIWPTDTSYIGIAQDTADILCPLFEQEIVSDAGAGFTSLLQNLIHTLYAL